MSSIKLDFNRRSFLHTAVTTLATAELATMGAAEAQTTTSIAH